MIKHTNMLTRAIHYSHAFIVKATGCLLLAALFWPVGTACAYDPALAKQALAVVDKAGRYYSTRLSLDGAYAWAWSEDLSKRRGEGSIGPTTGWVQPPGTPAVGAAYLRLHEITNDPYWLDAARLSARALTDTQLLSGGWYYSIEMNKSLREKWCYRASGMTPARCNRIDDNKIKNRTLLDDDTTQSVLRFLIWLDRVDQGENPAIRETVYYGLNQLVSVQFPNGSWPIIIEKGSRKDLLGKLKARFEKNWPREWVKPEHGPYYILNDNALRDVAHLYLVAADQYRDEKFLKAATRVGEFLIDAQLPAPQRGWAQTYNSQMQPVWGRKFEPPAVASHETAGAITCLIELYQRTGDQHFLEAAKEAAAWLRSVQLPDKDWARFYELSTNRPLYVDNNERLTYEPVNLLDHYNLKSQANIPQALAFLEAAQSKGERAPFWPSAADDLSEEALEMRVRALVAAVDSQGRWVEKGWIRGQTFVDAVFLIGRYVELAEAGSGK